MSKGNWLSHTFLGFMLFIAMGCSDATPSVGLLKTIKAFDFITPNIVTSSLTAVPVQAKCSSLITAVEMSFDGGNTWVSPTSHDASATANCNSGSFNMTLSKNNAPLNGMTVAIGQILTLKYRAQIKSGVWVYSDLTVKLQPSTSTSQEILAGAQVQSGSGVQLHGRIRGQNQQQASGGSFVLRGRITQ